MNSDRDLDYLDFDDDSDQEGIDSSEDEIDILLHGTPEQKRKMCRRNSNANKDSSSEDDFEKEMNAELNGQIKEIERRRGSVTAEAGCSGTSNKESIEQQRLSDDVYFDSDEEDMVTQGDKKKQQKLLSNDDLFYDPNIDDDNERWIEEKRRSYLPNNGSSSKQKQKRLPQSDAVLDCPACMTTLCLDCQRHDVYENQYRAMFVTNCEIDTSEFLKYPKASSRSRKRKKNKADLDTETSDDKFHPVKCVECNTVVAVYDEEEIYHFFNVLASY